MRIKKFLAIILVLTMLFVFAGCKDQTEEYSVYWYEDELVEGDTSGGDSTNESSVTDSNNSQTTQTTQTSQQTQTNSSSGNSTSGEKTWKDILAQMPPSLRGTTITVGNWNDISDINGLKAVISKFEKDTGIKVVWKKMSYSTYASELTAMVAAKTVPDVIRVKSVDPAILTSLQPLSNTGYDFSTSEWDKEVMNYYTVNGKVYATNMQNTLMQQPSCLLYNSTLIKKYDLEDPYTLWKNGKWTWDKFIEICEDFLDACDKGSYPWSLNTSYDYAALTGVSAADWNGEKFVSHLQDTQFLNACITIAQVKEKGITGENWFDRNGFEQGKVLFFGESLIGARTTHYYFTDLKATNALEAVPYPTIEGKKNYQVYNETEAYAVPKNAKNIEAVGYFLRYYLDAGNYNEKTFFANPHMLEVHNSMRSNKNIYRSAVEAVFTADTGIESGRLNQRLYNAAPAQMKTKLDEQVNVANGAVAASNKLIDKIGK